MYRSFLPFLFAATLFLLSTNKAQAYATVDIWNNSTDTIFNVGDVVKGIISYTLDEEFSEFKFGSDARTYFSASMTSGPFKLSPLSPAPDRKEILFEFTVPFDFASNDTSFFFSLRMYAKGQYYTQKGHELIKVRGIADIITPTNDAKVKGIVDFEWYKVLGATAYQFQLTRSTDGNNPKVDPQAIVTVLDTVLTTNTITLPMTFTGVHQWTVRSQVDDVWGEWVTPTVFEVEAAASVARDKEDDKIRLYPQPASTTVTIESSNGYVRRATVYDLAGKEVSTHGNISGIVTALNVSWLPVGSYRVVLELDDRAVSLPLIVE